MNPPWSMIFFTTLAGTGQGLFLALVGVDAAARLGLLPAQDASLFTAGAAGVLLLCGAGLVAASFHLGHPLRAWRAAAMWRTSWLSREVIVLPIFMAVVLAWGLAHWQAAPHWALGATGAALALLLYLCTGMIYAAVAVMRQWATPLTPLTFGLTGIASGLLAATALAAWLAPALATTLAWSALMATAGAALARAGSLWRNAHLAAGATLQTAIGLRHPRIVPMAQGLNGVNGVNGANGAIGGSFNLREFLHGRSANTLARVRLAALLLAALLPVAVLALLTPHPSAAAIMALLVVQLTGLLADRWLFFADAQHPQNLYYGGRP